MKQARQPRYEVTLSNAPPGIEELYIGIASDIAFLHGIPLFVGGRKDMPERVRSTEFDPSMVDYYPGFDENGQKILVPTITKELMKKFANQNPEFHDIANSDSFFDAINGLRRYTVDGAYYGLSKYNFAGSPLRADRLGQLLSDIQTQDKFDHGFQPREIEFLQKYADDLYPEIDYVSVTAE